MRRFALRAGLIALTVLPASVRSQQIGELTLHGGATVGLSPEGQGLRPAVNASLSFLLGPIALGPELGFYVTGPDSLSAGGGPENAFTGGGVLRFRLSPAAYLVGGAGAYWWDSQREPSGTYFSGSIGVGLRLGSGSGPSVEARLHQLLQNTGREGTRTFLMIGAGYRLRW